MSNYSTNVIRSPINDNDNNNSVFNQCNDIHNTYYLNNILIREFLSETCGMFWFIAFSLGNIANLVLYPESNMSWTGVAVSWGFNLMFGIYLASYNSQAHLNPCVSMCMYLWDASFTFTQLCIHSLAQLVGAFLAAAVVYGIYYDKIVLLNDDKKASSIFTTYKADNVNTSCAFFTEFIGTGFLVSGIFSILMNKSTKDHAAIFIGILLSSLVLSFGYQTAFAFNPARDLGPRIFTAMVGYSSFSFVDHYWWIPLVADYAGSITFVVLFHLVIKYQT